MAIPTTKYVLLFTIILVSINGINSQLLMAVRDISSLLENITDMSTVTSMILANILNRSADAQSRMAGSLDQMANTQTQMADTQSEMVLTQSHMANILNRSADTQTRMEGRLDQMANTQTQMANTLTQVVQLLQIQSQQLQNMTDNMSHMVEQMNTQNNLISLLPKDIPRDCSDLASKGQYPSGSYTIRPSDELGTFHVYCDMDTDNNGGWTVFQKRFDGSVDFFLGWEAYENGFGSPDREYWMGLRQINRMTKQGSWMLRIDLADFQDNTVYAEFESFSIGDAASFYRLSIGAYSGNAGDSLTVHNNQAFSTKDNDHDTWPDNCAQTFTGAWWFTNCHHSNLNGLYLGESQVSDTGLMWQDWKGVDEALKRSDMKMRRTR